MPRKLLSSWWKANRPSAPLLFDEELEQTIERLGNQPTLGLVYQSHHCLAGATTAACE